jgi:hypothetical protein
MSSDDIENEPVQRATTETMLTESNFTISPIYAIKTIL